MSEKTFYFLSGLPRSGSTVLASILNQNLHVYVTPTSPLLDQLIKNQDIWHSLQTVKANPMPDQLTNITRELIKAMYKHRPESIIIDKNRGWGKNMPASTILFEKEIKVIATVRDLPSIMTSWLTIFKKNPNSYMNQVLFQKGFFVTDSNILSEMWINMVKDCMESVQQLKKDAGNRLLLINYDDLVSNPQCELDKITEFLNLPTHNYQFTNIENDSTDDDLLAWGLTGLHQIRPKLEKISKHPRDILGEKWYNRFVELEKEYQ